MPRSLLEPIEPPAGNSRFLRPANRPWRFLDRLVTAEAAIRIRLVLFRLAAFWLVLLVLGATSATAAENVPDRGAAEGMENAFRQPGDAQKPWAYWWWLKGNVTRELITHDLEAMKRAGFGGLLHFDARGYHEGHVPPPESRMEFMSPEWREMLKWSIAEAGRLGLQVSVNLSSCAGALKGPWDVGEDAPKRLVWTSTKVRGPASVELSLGRPTEKFFWNVAVLAVRQADAVSTPAAAKPADPIELSTGWRNAEGKPGAQSPALEVLDLTDRADSQGRLRWDVPAGSWQVLRFGCMTMPGHEYDVDILSEKAVTGHFDRMGKAILADAKSVGGKALTHFYSVSWEGASPSWTLGLDEEFLRRRGYAMRSYLPVLAGIPLPSRERFERFLCDYHTTLADLFRDHMYETLRQRCHEAGLLWHSESGGPWERKLSTFVHADQLAFLARNDMPQGEFWFRGQPHKQQLNRPIAMAAHLYGRPLAAAEAFTHMVQHWSAWPGGLKADADIAFCDGINHLVWHTFTASLPEFGAPGDEYFAGTHINPNITWFNEARPYLDYLSRCQVLLRRGLFVGDVCCYVGDNAYLHWGRAEKWSAKPTYVLGKGYTYDLVNTEVLLERMSVRDGDLVLPDGMSYRVLVVDMDSETASPQALSKIQALVEAGATVALGTRRPKRTSGLCNYPACDEQVARLADALWAGADRPQRRAIGKGLLVTGTPLDDVLKSKAVMPDFEGPFDYTHRRAADLDLFFVAGQGAADCTFRVRDKAPEFWDPQTGAVRPALAWRSTEDGRTVVPLQLPKTGSTFVVFRKPASQPHLVSMSGPAGGMEVETSSANSLQVRLWRPGDYGLVTSAGRQLPVTANLPASLALAGPWNVRFQSGRGAPELAVFEQLTPWEQHSDPRIRFFSGKATYSKTFVLNQDQAGSLVRLQLGDVKYIARVRLNGVELGVVWTAPWSAELTGVACAGENRLDIDVVNLWVNRLIGDASLPPGERIGKTNVPVFPGKRNGPAWRGFWAEDRLLPSGLLGPVELQFGRRQTVAW